MEAFEDFRTAHRETPAALRRALSAGDTAAPRAETHTLNEDAGFLYTAGTICTFHSLSLRERAGVREKFKRSDHALWQYISNPSVRPPTIWRMRVRIMTTKATQHSRS